MILIDTSIWADHFRKANVKLAIRASNVEIVQHPFVTGELAMGNLSNRLRTIELLNELPQAIVMPSEGLLEFVESEKLAGTGLGLIDAHLLASCQIGNHRLWTRDKRLASQADRLNLAHDLP